MDNGAKTATRTRTTTLLRATSLMVYSPLDCAAEARMVTITNFRRTTSHTSLLNRDSEYQLSEVSQQKSTETRRTL